MNSMDTRLIYSFCDTLDTNLLTDLTPMTQKFFLAASKYTRSTKKGDIDIANAVIEKLEPHLKILSWNVNGMRSNILGSEKWRKCNLVTDIDYTSNLGELILHHDPDILCFQETRCNSEVAGCFQVKGYYQYWNCSKGTGARAGARYSGVSLWSKIRPHSVSYNLPTLPQPDQEGRIIVAEYDYFTLITTYVPNAGTNYEYRTTVWDKAMRVYLAQLQSEGRNVIWCGDLNVARTAQDVFFGNPNSSTYNPAALKGVGSAAVAGFTKAERDNFEDILSEGYADVYRYLYPTEKDAYTWWNPRIPIFRSINKGWRLDYFVVNDKLAPCVRNMQILRESGLLTKLQGKPQGSDHAAILLDINLDCIECIL